MKKLAVKVIAMQTKKIEYSPQELEIFSDLESLIEKIETLEVTDRNRYAQLLRRVRGSFGVNVFRQRYIAFMKQRYGNKHLRFILEDGQQFK